MADAKKIFIDLKLTKESHTAYVARTRRNISRLRGEFQLTKSELETAFKELDSARVVIVSLRSQLGNK